jgi:hypothetical protein
MVRIFHKVKHRTNAVKCLAFDNFANVDFGRLTEQFGRGVEEVIITKLSISPKPTQKRLMMRFTQKRAISTKQYIPRLMVIFTHCPPDLA